MHKIIILLLLFVVGCTPSTKETHDYILPNDLQDCKVYEMYNGYREITVVRCPKSDVSTSRKVGKVRQNNITTEGIE